MTEQSRPHRIVIVGGGASGLELATRLGDSLGKKRKAEIILIDAVRTHVWKPLLHQLAAGSFDTHAEEIEFIAQARWHHFQFRQGRFAGLDREKKEIILAPMHDDRGEPVLPEQRVAYDTLVIALGSLTNDFGTAGCAEHAIRLDTPEAARHFNDRLINACLHAQVAPREKGQGRMTVTLVGGGATGVELAAELHSTARVLASFGLENIDPESDFKIVLVEASPRLLPALPERLSTAAARELRRLGVELHTNERVVEIGPDFVRMGSGKVIPTTLTVWAAGIKAPDFLKDIGGLETNRINQVVVHDTLQSTRDPNIFAMGDCASCPQPGDKAVPPRAQAAHQQAQHMTRQIVRHLSGKPLKAYRYVDRGSLVSLANYSSVGSLMGSLARGGLFIDGYLARMMYWGLHKQHQLALSGFVSTAAATLIEWISKIHRPRIKLH